MLIAKYAAVLITPSKMHIKVAKVRKLFAVFPIYVRIERNYHSHVVFTRSCKRL